MTTSGYALRKCKNAANNVETMLHYIETTLHNVGTTLMQRCFNLALTLVKAILNPIGLVRIMDLQIHE